jgi:predicted DNA-binding protein (MmcQ/YjbR family)
MVTKEMVRTVALSFPEAEESPHFEKTSFRVRKKIFATITSSSSQCVIKLSMIDQSVFSAFNREMIYPVKGAWGKQGWTTIELKKVRRDLFTDAFTTAYCTVAPKKLACQVR